jgi:hypothetical protein
MMMTTTTMYLDQINKISLTIIIENYIHEHSSLQISSSMEKKPCKLALLNSYEKTAGTNSSRNEKPSLVSNGWTDIQKEASPLRPASARIFLWCL